jgi:hypothetical protein
MFRKITPIAVLLTLALAGSGFALPALTVTTSDPMEFGSIYVGDEGSGIMTVKNTGTIGSTLHITGFVFTGDAVFSISPPATKSLARNASQNWTIYFDPTSAGDINGQVEIQNSDGIGSGYVTLHGTALEPAGIASTDYPAGMDFGIVQVTQSTDIVDLTIQNIGPADLNVTAVSITVGSDVFSITATDAPDLPYVLGTDAFYTYTVTFTPIAEATYNGTLSIESDDPASPLNVSLTGNGKFISEEGYCNPDSADANGIAVSGSYAYAPIGNAGLRKYDISTPSNPTKVGDYNTAGTAYGVCVSGDYIYVAWGVTGLVVLNVNGAATPTLAWSLNIPDTAFAVQVYGDYAYVADGVNGMRVININTHLEVGSLIPGGAGSTAREIDVEYPYAYLADAAQGLRIINITNPASPSLTGSRSGIGVARNVEVVGNYAYMADDINGLKIVDCSHRPIPQTLGTYDSPGTAYGVAILDNFAYIADGSPGVEVVDITDASNPVVAATFTTPGTAKEIVINGNYAYISYGTSGLRVLDVSHYTLQLDHSQKTDQLIPNRWKLIGIPVNVTNGNVASLFSDLTGAAGTDWRLSRWCVKNQNYIRYGEADQPPGPAGEVNLDPPDFAPGLGFWVKQVTANPINLTISTSENIGRVPQNQRYSVPLQRMVDNAPPGLGNEDYRGLTQIANPFNYTCDWRNTSIYNFSAGTFKSIVDAATAGWISGYAYQWTQAADGRNGEYIAINYQGNADPPDYNIPEWEGFWVEQTTTDSLKVRFQPTGFNGGLMPRPPGNNEDDEEGWALQLIVSTAEADYRSSDNRAAVNSLALDGYDRFDAFEFTPMGDSYVQLYFPHPEFEEVLAEEFTYDYRSLDFTQPKVWDFTVQTWKLQRREIVLTWPGLGDISRDYRFALRNLDTGEEIAPMQPGGLYSFTADTLNATVMHFRLTATYNPNGVVKEDPTPTQFGMVSVYPNPFNNVMTMEYRLPNAVNISLRIFDLVGREVAVLQNGNQIAGAHKITWNSDRMASGLYYVKLDYAGVSSMQKVLLLK